MKTLFVVLLLATTSVQAKDNYDWLNWMIITGQFSPVYPANNNLKYERPVAKPACEDPNLKQLGIVVECPKKEEVKK